MRHDIYFISILNAITQKLSFTVLNTFPDEILQQRDEHVGYRISFRMSSFNI
jgi:hypothetical protein